MGGGGLCFCLSWMSEGFHNVDYVPFAPEQTVRMRNRPQRGDGINICPAQQADVVCGSFWVAARVRGQADVKHALVLQVVIFTLSPVAPWALSNLLFLPKQFHNCDICSYIKYNIISETENMSRALKRWAIGPSVCHCKNITLQIKGWWSSLCIGGEDVPC